MGTTNDAEHRPLWYQIEAEILGLGDTDLAANKEQAVHQIAAALDEKGLNVSRTGGKLLHLRKALDARINNGRALLSDLNRGISALTLDDVDIPHVAAAKLARELGASWPTLKGSEQIADLRILVEATRLDLLVDQAKALDDDQGIRLLRSKELTDETICERMGISQEKLDEVDAAIAAEKAEILRVQGLLEAVADNSAEEQIRHLINNEVADASIVAIGGFEQGALDAEKLALKEEIKEKQRLAEEAAARKKAEAEGPSLDNIPPDEMLEYIESIREILEFSEVEKEIRTMCEQSSIPNCLVDIAVSEPDKLDELEEKAENA